MTPEASRVPLTLLALAILGCASPPIPEWERFPAGTPLIPHTLMLDGSRIRYVDAGHGPAVVLVHGIASSIYSWRYTIIPLVQAGYRVVALDTRGFGFSDKPDSGYSNGAYARLVTGLLDSLSIPDAVLVGHSMGGAIAADVALAAPERVRGLVLIDAAGLGARWPLAVRAARWPIVGRFLTAFRGRRVAGRILRSVYANPALVTDRDVDQYYAPVADPRFPHALRGVLREFRFDDLTGRLDSLITPTLVVWGQEDRWIPLAVGRAMASRLPRGALVVIPGTGHSPAEERPALVLSSLLAFLRDGLPEPPRDLASVMAH